MQKAPPECSIQTILYVTGRLDTQSAAASASSRFAESISDNFMEGLISWVEKKQAVVPLRCCPPASTFSHIGIFRVVSLGKQTLAFDAERTRK